MNIKDFINSHKITFITTTVKLNWDEYVNYKKTKTKVIPISFDCPNCEEEHSLLRNGESIKCSCGDILKRNKQFLEVSYESKGS